MFDISFSELLLCFLVALVVLGPERMPGVARAVGRWVGKARGYARNLTAELERETHIVEMKKQIQDAHRVLREQSDDVRSSVDLNLKAMRDETSAVVKTVEAPPPLMSGPAVSQQPPLAAPDSSTPAPATPSSPDHHGA